MGKCTVCVLDKNHKKIHTVKSELMKYPSGAAVDDKDNIFVASKYRLQKFTSSGVLIDEKTENNDFRGLVIHNNHVYICLGSYHALYCMHCIIYMYICTITLRVCTLQARRLGGGGFGRCGRTAHIHVKVRFLAGTPAG